MNLKLNPLVLLGGGVAAYLLLAPKSANGSNPITAALSSFMPGAAAQPAQVPNNYGINSGIAEGNGSHYGCSNYNVLLQANPNLGNPNYQMTPAEAQTYFNNYLDLQQWWGQDTTKKKWKTIQGTMQYHWTTYGCAEKRIFLQLIPPSTGNFVPAPVNPKSGGHGIFGSILKAATVVAGGVLAVGTFGIAAPVAASLTTAALTLESGIHGVEEEQREVLSDQELQILFQGAAVLYEILPLYFDSDPILVSNIKMKMDEVLKQYS